jgi:hypothetical protein
MENPVNAITYIYRTDSPPLLANGNLDFPTRLPNWAEITAKVKCHDSRPFQTKITMTFIKTRPALIKIIPLVLF